LRSNLAKHFDYQDKPLLQDKDCGNEQSYENKKEKI